MNIPGYKIERLIAEGGTSSVYLALQESLGRRVAIKLLRKFDNSRQAERFVHEARIIASLEHRNVITIYDVGAVGERYYIAMEYLEGGSLADQIEHGMQPAVALSLLASVAGCLEFVHCRDIVHRDIKPGNILFHADGTPKLTDFGIAKQLDGDQELTLEGSAFGSPYYLSPEQAEGRLLDGRSDIYSLGIVFFQMLTGRKPYAESSHIETIVAHLSNPIPVLPDELQRYQGLLEKMIAKAPENRVASAKELIGLIRALRPTRSDWHDDRVQDTQLDVLADAPSGVGKRMLTSVLESSPFNKVLAVAALLLTAISIAWLVDDGDQQQHAVPMAGRPSGIELRYERGGAVFERQISPAVRATENKSAVIASEPEPQVPTSEPVTPMQDVSRAPAFETVADVDEEPVEDFLSDSEQLAETLSVEPLQPLVETEIDPLEETRELVAELMQAGDRALKDNRLTTPANDNAFDYYSKAAEIDPAHVEAGEGIDQIAERYSALAKRAMKKEDYRSANVFVRRGLAVRRNHAGLLAVRKKIAERERFVANTPAPDHSAAITRPPDRANTVSREFEGTSVTSSGPEGTGNMVKDFKNVWRSVFD